MVGFYLAPGQTERHVSVEFTTAEAAPGAAGGGLGGPSSGARPRSERPLCRPSPRGEPGRR